MATFIIRRTVYQVCEIEAESIDDVLENVIPDLAEEDYEFVDSEETIEELSD